MNRLSWENRVGRAAATYPGMPRQGNGYVAPIIGKTDFAFDPRSGGTGQIVPLAIGVDTSSWVSGVVVARIFSKTGTWTSTSLSCVVQNIMLCPEEPDVVFVAATNVASIVVADANSGTNAGTLVVGALGAMGPMVRVILSLTGASGSAANCALGIDLVGRPA